MRFRHGLWTFRRSEDLLYSSNLYHQMNNYNLTSSHKATNLFRNSLNIDNFTITWQDQYSVSGHRKSNL